MKISEIKELLGAELLCGEEMPEEDFSSAFGSDMMSDVLAFVNDQAVLLTGLCNLQVIRTANMMDMKCVVFVRAKKPTEDIVALAKDSGITVLTTDKTMYISCGILYSNGLRSDLENG